MTKQETKTPESLADHARAVGEAAVNQATRTRDAVAQAAQSMADAVEESRAVTADRMEGAASVVRERTESLPGGPRVRQVARTAADGLTTTADYVRTHDLKGMAEAVEAVVKNNPGPALMVAAAFGFFLARALARD
ncbi:MAG: hypothetical protein ABW318_17955 [Vicinamibacterales bacterium]